MDKKVSILILEDCRDDVELVVRKLQVKKFNFEYDWADCADQMKNFLHENNYDVIISDYSMPGFGAREALDIRRDLCSYTPFIIVSGVIGEEAAADIMKQGATDYLLKDNLKRLLPAIGKAVSDAEIMRVAREETEELNRIKELYACIVESSIDGIIGCSLDGVISSWNRGAENIFGYSADEAVGRSLSILSGEGMPNEFPLILKQVMSGESFSNYETVRSNKKGEMVFLSIVVSPVRSGNSDISGASVIIRDISNLQKAEKKLLASENLYRFVFEKSSLPIVFIDNEGLIVLANSEFEKLSGYSRDLLQGMMNCSEFIDEEIFRKLLEECKCNLKPLLSADIDLAFVTIDGSVKRVITSAQKISDENGVVLFFNDVTFYKDKVRDTQNLLLLERNRNLQYMKQSMIELERMSGTIDCESGQFLYDQNNSAPSQAVLNNLKRNIKLEELLSGSEADLGRVLSSMTALYGSGHGCTVEVKCANVLFIEDKITEENVCRIVDDRIVEAIECSADNISVEVTVVDKLIKILVSDNGRQRLERDLCDVCEERASSIHASVYSEFRSGLNHLIVKFEDPSARAAVLTAVQDSFSRRKSRVGILSKVQIVRTGLSGILNSRNFVVSGEFEAVENLVKFIENNSIDVVMIVLDVEKGLDLETLKAFTHKFPALPVMVLAHEEENHYASYAFRSGAKGFIYITETAEEILKGLSAVVAGEIYVKNPSALSGEAFSGGNAGNRFIEEMLSSREMEIFVLLGKGAGPAEISKMMNLSVKTIETYRRRIREKLDLATASDLLKFAINWLHGKRQGSLPVS